MKMTVDQALDVLRGLDPHDRHATITDEVEYAALRLIFAVQRVRALHRQVIDDSWPTPGHCEECLVAGEDGDVDYVPYPCPTIRALDGAA